MDKAKRVLATIPHTVAVSPMCDFASCGVNFDCALSTEPKVKRNNKLKRRRPMAGDNVPP